MQLICSRHGVSEHKLYGTRWKCKKCEYVYSRRYLDNLKLKAIEYAGGKCQECGYNKCMRALHFHHVDPSLKEFGIFESRPGFKKTRNWDLLKIEIDKCILLCGNCHMELHDKDEKIVYEEIDIKLNRLDIEHLNKLIHKGKCTADESFEKAIKMLMNRLPKLSKKELRHKEWMIRNKFKLTPGELRHADWVFKNKQSDISG